MVGLGENGAVPSLEKKNRLSLLLVDDDVELCSMMQEFFREAGHHLDVAYDGREGLMRILNGSYDLAILDVMMPVIDGVTVLQQIRRRANIPVILLTARAQPEDRIHGLNAGADDYVPKPFDPDELLARIHAILRRTQRSRESKEKIITIGDLRLDATTREVRLSGNPIELTSIEFDVLELLVRSVGQVVSRDEITMLIFGRESTPYDRFLDVHISHLRKKLECGKTLIRAIRGVGYIFTGQF
jgi:DNA-binding response OmpR family regulator